MRTPTPTVIPPECPPTTIVPAVVESVASTSPHPLAEASPPVVTFVDALKSIGILCVSVAATRRSLAALGDAEFSTEYFERGVYAARWLFESLTTLILAVYYMVGFFRAAWATSLAEALTAAASCFFFVRLHAALARHYVRNPHIHIHAPHPPHLYSHQLYMAFLWRVLSDAKELPASFPKFAIPELRLPRAAVHRRLTWKRLQRPRALLILWAAAHAYRLHGSAHSALSLAAHLQDARTLEAFLLCAASLIIYLPIVLGVVAAFSLLVCSASDASSAPRNERDASWLWPIGSAGESTEQRLPERAGAPLRIVFLTIGTRGDVQPFVALGQHLRDTGGHTVVIATSQDFKAMTIEAGLEFGDIGVARIEQPTSWLHVNSVGAMIEASAPRMVADYDIVASSFLRIADSPRADVLVGTAMTLTFAINISESRGIPAWIAKLAPDIPSAAFAPPGSDSSMFGFVNLFKAAYYWIRVALAVNRTRISAAEDEFRIKHLGLGPVLAAERLEDMAATPQLLGFSRALSPAPLDWPAWAFQCGFWLTAETGGSLYDPHVGQVPHELRAFMAPEIGKAPVVCVTLGSMTNASRPTLVGDIVSVLRMRHLRVLVIRGWSQGGLESDAARGLPAPGVDEGFLAVDEAPHSWVFPHCAAVVHHGGAGTTSRALASGVPSLIIPVLRWSDQWTWGALVEQRGVGVLLRTRNPSAAAFSDALEVILATVSARPTGTARHPITDAASSLGATLRAERACAPVAMLLDSCLCNLVLPLELAGAVVADPSNVQPLPPLTALTREQRMCARHCVQCNRLRHIAMKSSTVGSVAVQRAASPASTNPLTVAPMPRAAARQRRGVSK